MIIEFCGIPGGGKTTLEEALMREWAKKGLSVLTRREAVQSVIQRKRKLKGRASTALYRARVWGDVYAARLRFGFWEGQWPRARAMPLYWLCEERGFHKAAGDNVWNISEGVAQHFAACKVWNGDAAKSLIPLLEDIGPVCIVYVTTPAALALGRLKERGIPRSWPAVRQEDLISVLCKFQDQIDQTIEIISKNKFVQVFRTDGEDPQMLAETIHKKLERLGAGSVMSGRARGA